MHAFVIVCVLLALSQTGAFAQTRSPREPVNQTRTREIRDVRAELEAKRTTHELVRLQLRGPYTRVTGHVGKTGRRSFDLVDPSNQRMKRVFYSDVVAFLDRATDDQVAVVHRTWAAQHQGRVIALVILGIAVATVIRFVSLIPHT
jgi:hypothetical protein